MKLSSETYKRGAIHSSFFSVLAKGVAFVQHLLIAYYFGANTGTDLYFYLFNLALLIGGMIQTITTSILIPQSMLLRHADSAKTEMKYLNSFMYSFTALILLFMVLLSLAGNKVPASITNFPLEDIEKYISIYYASLLLVVLLVINLFLTEILVSFKFFTLPLVCNLLLNSGIILALLLFKNTIGVSSMIYGSCVASVINTVMLIILMKQKLQWQFLLTDFSVISYQWKAIAGLTFNQGVVIFASTFPMYLLSYYQPGVITIINYAQKFIQAPLAWIQQFTAVLQIKLNNLKGNGKVNEIYRSASQIAIRLFLLTLFTSFIIFLLRNFIAETLFGLGKMPVEAGSKLSYLIGILTFSMPFTAMSLAYMKVFFTQGYIRQYVTVMLFVNIVSCILYAVSIYYWQENGYAFVYVLIEMLTTLIIWLYLQRRLRRRANRLRTI